MTGFIQTEYVNVIEVPFCVLMYSLHCHLNLLVNSKHQVLTTALEMVF